ncbi:MAG: hypothetical protein AAF382_05675 [Pseudomonadota bacterium]
MPKPVGDYVGMSSEEFSELDLVGRPFLSEQGNTVTRGFVTGFRCDIQSWYLDLAQVDYLDKKTKQWNRRLETDEYTSDRDTFGVTYSDSTHTKELYLEIGGYGMSVFLGAKSDHPWKTLVWCDILQTDVFKGGILGETKLP